MPVVMVEGCKDIDFHNGLVRIDCVSVGPNGEMRKSGTLVISGNVSKAVLQALANAMQELDKKMREHAAGQDAKVGELVN